MVAHGRNRNVMATLNIVGISTLHVDGYPDGEWSQVVFATEPYKGQPTRRLYANAENPATGSRSNYTPAVDKKTGLCSMPFKTGESWPVCTAYIFAGDDWGAPISNVINFTIPL